MNLTAEQVGRMVGVKASTIRQYRWLGSMPQPDDYGGRQGRQPLWKQETIDRWIAARPGRGRPYKKVLK